MRRYKLRHIIVVSLILFTIWKVLNFKINGEITTYKTTVNPPIHSNEPARSLSRNEGKLLTLSTSFIDIQNATNEEASYRYRAQLNFLKTTQFPLFQSCINFIIFTDDPEWVRLIQSEYYNANVLPSPSLNKSAPPMIRDIFLKSMQTHDSTFYMFANADNIYDISLIQTLRGVLRAVNQGRIRSKLLIVGQRSDLNYKGIIRNQNDVKRLLKYAYLHPPVAKDYFIVTKDSFEWEYFPDFYIGRRWYDSYIVQSAFFNEVELIDATATIGMIHQTKRVGYWSSLNADPGQNDWNLSLLGPDTHSSIRCARYTTQPPFSEVRIVDKQRNLGYLVSPPVSQLYNQMLSDILSLKQTKPKSDFMIIILARDRPNSIRRLLLSLSEADYGEERGDLTVLLDRGRTGAFDIEVLKVLNKFSWNFGNFAVILQQQYTGALQHWMLAWNITCSQEYQALILEDNVVLSPYFYRVLRAAYYTYLKYSYIAGFSLDFPSEFSDNLSFESNIILSEYRYSRAFSPHPRCQKQFIEWYSQHKEEYIMIDRSTRHHTLHSLFKLYLTSQNKVVGYLLDSGGLFATRAVFTILGDDDFLLNLCYLIRNSTVVMDRHLSFKIPQGTFPDLPPLIP